jgi:hypothetical protein
MRLQLRSGLGPRASSLGLGIAILLGSASAAADGTITTRGVYYKERATRVIQPMLDAAFEVGARGLVNGHLLVDAITSASASSGAVAAQPFTEKRYEGGAGYAHELDGPAGSWLDVVRVAAQTRLSVEPDYRSFYAGARTEVEVAQKNATIGLGGGVSSDRMDASGSQDPGGLGGGIQLQCPGDMGPVSDACALTTYVLFASASQVVSRNAVVAVSYDLAHLDGFQANPYRQVITPPTTRAERHPYSRTRHAVAVSARLFLPRSETTLIGAYRYYWDDWDIHAHTPELRIIQAAGRAADASLRYRYYRQDASYFWQRRYVDPGPDAFVTDDPKMSPFDGHLVEAKLGILGEAFGLEDRWSGARFEGILAYAVQDNRFGNAVVAHVALTVPFDY